MHEVEQDDPASARPRLIRSGPHRRRIVGDLDAFTARVLEPPLRRLIEKRRMLVLDLRGVRVLTAGGLAMLERVHAYASGLGQRLSMRVPRGSLVHRVLRFSDLPDDSITLDPAGEEHQPRDPG